MRDSTRSLLKLELLICFLPCSLWLVLGAIVLPEMLIRSFQSATSLQLPLLVTMSVAGGIIGLWTLLRVVSALFGGKEIIENPSRILVGALLGAAPLILQVVLALSPAGEIGWGVFVAMLVLPLLATVHILYLSRHLLLASFQHERGNEA